MIHSLQIVQKKLSFLLFYTYFMKGSKEEPNLKVFTFSIDKKIRSENFISKARQNLIKPTIFRSFFLCAVQSFRQSLFRAKLKVKLYSPRVPIFLCAQRSFINSFECRFESLGSYRVELFSEREFMFVCFKGGMGNGACPGPLFA